MNRTDFTLEQWLAWMEKSHPVAIDLGLERVNQVYLRLNLDFSATRVITVAGTNGKGSTVCMLESIYRCAGYSTACYTSPHLQIYNERVLINGQLSTDTQLVEAFRAVDQAREGVSLSYFEMGTLAALWLVAKQQPQVAILEVGLGGRLDAVNVVDADVAVITTIGIDHVDWLGDNREKIGSEKAGIFRQNRPAVCGELDPPATIAAYAEKIGAPLWQQNQQFSFEIVDNEWRWQGLDAQGELVAFTQLPLPALPLQNASTALQAIVLNDLPCDIHAIRNGLSKARVAGRMDRKQLAGCSVILDVAHNPQSAQYLADQLAKLQLHKVSLVLGMLADKDCSSVVAALKPVIHHWHLVSLDVFRGQSSAQLSKSLLQQGVSETDICCYDSVAQALESLKGTVDRDGDTLVIAGSFYTVGDAYEYLAQEEK
jgi:dihydrofolate synthase/folylpolyglutamate synthase